jgi:hypothetical protein
MSEPGPRPPEHVHLLRALASLALDYVRWTQLVPMLFAWTFLLLLVGALLLTNFQDASFSLLERGMTLYERIAGPFEEGPAPDPPIPPSDPASENPAADGADGALRFSDEDIMPVVLRAWGLLALVGWLFGVLRTLLFGPREPARLGRKLRIAAYVAAGCSGLMWIAYLLGSETFHGSAAGWAALFTGVPFGVWLISAWSLGVGHAIGAVQRHLHA